MPNNLNTIGYLLFNILVEFPCHLPFIVTYLVRSLKRKIFSLQNISKNIQYTYEKIESLSLIRVTKLIYFAV